jgi:hypothetical protein
VRQGEPEARFAEVLASAVADPNVLGLVVFGSRGAGLFVTAHSDFDAFVVLEQADPTWQTVRGEPAELVPMLLPEFAAHGLPGSTSEWHRSSFIRARVELDRLDGGIAAIVERKTRLLPAEAAAIARDALGTYQLALPIAQEPA